LQQFFKGKKGKNKRAFASEIAGLELSTQDTQSAELMDFEEAGGNQMSEKTTSQEFEIFPADPAIRKKWFSLTIRERQVVALVCMGYRNYEIASMLGVGYPTIQTHLQKIFEIRSVAGMKFGQSISSHEECVTITTTRLHSSDTHMVNQKIQ
jgi:DNA-binding CsgD family transcriptional regulator